MCVAQAKGFPDLATRRFLSTLHSVNPELKLVCLVDFDPHGVAILRTYTKGSKRLEHENDTTVPEMRWLGIRSADILSQTPDANEDESQVTGSQESQGPLSQSSLSRSEDGAQLHQINCLLNR